ncbi:mycofactocin system transcriptional regulator [Nocardioides agariphilus]|uniref:Mycofactocin system transcriptional regulator n=1 Tax=Nocardioides agariphilus TaxID=433664 RepID=A0A930YGN7_9ACTN|nr:mycofactocin system transcriptional regulator [Nocardioides agariphilus]MBF4766227.1 mycofactocin system transcriptional regulator [Nocardioides agariphilus]
MTAADQPPATAARQSVGRPVVTSHAAIEQSAFRLFAAHGFEGTTLEMIAAEVGVGRRTISRYFTSKNDIPWGQFDRTLTGFRQILDAMPPDLPVATAVRRGVLAFNQFPPDADPPHRQRMRLILETPALLAHSILRYEQWRAVIAEYVARRLGHSPGDLLPRTVGQVSLALALTAYESWLADDSADLNELLAATYDELTSFLELREHST